MPYRIALLDDELHQLERTRALAEQLLKNEQLDSTVMSYHSAFDMPSLSYDAYMLDISMPGMDGLAVARQIRASGSSAPIIFVTGIENRVFEAIRMQPLRFVRKNLLEDELPEAIHALRDELRKSEQNTLAIQSDGMLLRVPVSRILYIESSDKVQQVVLADKRYEVRSTMSWFEKQLIPQGFYRTHRCYLLNLQAVYSINGTDAVLSNGTLLPISRFKLGEIKEAFKRMMFHE